MTGERGRSRLSAGLAVSALAHVALLSAISDGRLFQSGRPSDPFLQLEAASETELPLISPGALSAPTSTSLTWLGFETPTEHRAPESTTNQPALSPEAGAGGVEPAAAPAEPAPALAERPDEPLSEPETPAEPVPDSEPVAEATPEPTESPAAEPSEIESEASPSFETATGLKPELASEGPEPIPVADLGETLDALRQNLADIFEAARRRALAEAREAAARHAAGAASPSPPQTEPGDAPPSHQAEPSSSEADAASTEDALEYRPGRPLARKGVEITTVRPQFTTLTRATASPRSPLALIAFGRDGRAKGVRLLQASGNSDVDAAVIFALYRWTAKGEEIQALPADDPEATVQLKIRIRFR